MSRNPIPTLIALAAVALAITACDDSLLGGRDDPFSALEFEGELHLELRAYGVFLIAPVVAVNRGQETIEVPHGPCPVRIRARRAADGVQTRPPEENGCGNILYEPQLEPGDSLHLEGWLLPSALGPLPGEYQLTGYVDLGGGDVGVRAYEVALGTVQVGYHPAFMPVSSTAYGARIIARSTLRNDSLHVGVRFLFPESTDVPVARLKDERAFEVTLYGRPDLTWTDQASVPRSVLPAAGSWETRVMSWTDSAMVAVPLSELPPAADGVHWLEVRLPLEDGSVRIMNAGTVNMAG